MLEVRKTYNDNTGLSFRLEREFKPGVNQVKTHHFAGDLVTPPNRNKFLKRMGKLRWEFNVDGELLRVNGLSPCAFYTNTYIFGGWSRYLPHLKLTPIPITERN